MSKMWRTLQLAAAAAALGATAVLAQAQPTCTLENKCPREAPCCSQYGQCGVGAYCLGGCDPRMSFSLDSCVPAPVCQSRTMPMSNLDRVVSVDKYLGDASTADWVMQGQALSYNGATLLTMPPRSVGTVLASTVYMWYGNVKAKVKTSRGAGVVTAFILLSDVKDEIDYEWVGMQLTTTQTNYYFQGIPNYDNSGNITSPDSTYDNWHTYEIHWTPDEITWLVDGQVGRTKKRADTWNATSNQWAFPQTPARVQLSIWPGGADTNAAGTIAWAGGPIDWNSPDIQAQGYYYATFGEITIECFNASSPPGTNRGKSYTFSATKGTNDTVIDGDKGTVLKSFLGTGLDMDVGGGNSNGAATVPGGSNSGPGVNGQAAGGGSGADINTCSPTDFSQSCSGNGLGSDATTSTGRGSAFAAIILTIAGLFWL